MNVIAWSPNLTPEKCKEAGVTFASKEELFKTADVITIHVVLGPRSRGLVGREDLLRMKPTAYIVNTARGPSTTWMVMTSAVLNNSSFEAKVTPASLHFS